MIKIYEGLDRPIDEILERTESTIMDNVCDIVRDIIYNIRKSGDAALLDYTEKFDGSRPDSLEVSKEEIDSKIFCFF